MDRIEQIRRAHKSARPKKTNPAWVNTHRDLGVALQEIERLSEKSKDCMILRAFFEAVCDDNWDAIKKNAEDHGTDCDCSACNPN